jgi:formylglycine-generating enzyme required for sulfatase activity
MSSRVTPRRPAALPIARYPITNTQWRAFMDAGGYHERRWWSAAGWQAKENEDWKQPREWENSHFNGANQPTIGIS